MNAKIKLFAATCALTYVAIQLSGAITGALFMRAGWSVAVLAVILTFIPTFGYSVILSAAAWCLVVRRWPTWILYPVSLALTVLTFIPIIHHVPTKFGSEPRHAMLESQEIPLLGICILAGVVGAFVCLRTLRARYDKGHDNHPSHCDRVL